MGNGINVTVEPKKISDMGSSQKKNIKNILSSNGVKTENSYTVSIDTDGVKAGVKVTTAVLPSSIKAGSNVYVYCYNKNTGKLECKSRDSEGKFDGKVWTKAVYKSALYDLKTRKFKCTNLTYSDSGRVNYIEFEEI